MFINEVKCCSICFISLSKFYISPSCILYHVPTCRCRCCVHSVGISPTANVEIHKRKCRVKIMHYASMYSNYDPFLYRDAQYDGDLELRSCEKINLKYSFNIWTISTKFVNFASIFHKLMYDVFKQNY